MDVSTLQPLERARLLLSSADQIAAQQIAAPPAELPEPIEPAVAPEPPIDPRILELTRLGHYRQAVWCSLQSMAPNDTEQTWEALRASAPSLALSPLVWVRASAQTPAEDEALEIPQLAECVRDVRSVAAAALELAEREHRERAARSRQAARAAGVLLAVVVAAAVIVLFGRLFNPVDLAKGKPWKASSTWAICEPERGVCGPVVTRILFCTQEDDSPWFQIDLGQPTKFSSLTIVNRRDGDYKERAVPLVLEVSDDTVKWRELAKENDPFSSWKPSFPTEQARFVRLRVARKSWLHLESVKVHP